LEVFWNDGEGCGSQLGEITSMVPASNSS